MRIGREDSEREREREIARERHGQSHTTQVKYSIHTNSPAVVCEVKLNNETLTLSDSYLKRADAPICPILAHFAALRLTFQLQKVFIPIAVKANYSYT